MSKSSILERRRATWPATMLGGCAFAGYFITSFVAQAIVLAPQGWGEPIGESVILPIVAFFRLWSSYLLPYMHWSDGPALSAVRLLGEDKQTLQGGLIALSSIVAGVVGASPLYRWKLSTIPRRLGTYWLDTDIPRWSETSDAISYARSHYASLINETGLGLEIAPGINLSKSDERLSLCAVGMPGSGKTVTLWWLIEQLRRRRAKLIVHCTKGDFTSLWPDDNFTLLAPHDARSWGWAIGQDIGSTLLAREFAAALIVASSTSPQWAYGAQEIFVGVIVTLISENGENWGWRELSQAIRLSDAALREFATRYHLPASRYLALGEGDAFNQNAGSFVSTLMAPIGRLIDPLADAWGDLAPDCMISLKAWLDEPDCDRPALILQRAPNLQNLSKAWIGAAIDVLIDHALGTRGSTQTADHRDQAAPEVWFVLDELPQIGLNPDKLRNLLETGRDLDLRALIGIQNFAQLDRLGGSTTFADEILQLTGALIALKNAPGPDAKKITESRLSAADVRTWKTFQGKFKTTVEPDKQEILVLKQTDLSDLKLSADGVPGYLISGNYAFGVEWPFPALSTQRPARVPAQWLARMPQRQERER